MSEAFTADVAVVGAGVSGLLVASELVRAGRDVVVLERGTRASHADQLAGDASQTPAATAAHNDESPPDTERYPWDYGYAVGGCSLRWSGIAVRLLPADFELRSRYGVGRDWPIGYGELEPFYADAERILGVAGGPGAQTDQPAHPLSPIDRLLAERLAPYVPVPQARPSAERNGRAPCTALARCRLCPSDARWSALHLLDDEQLDGHEGFRLLEATAAARIRVRDDHAAVVEAVRADREHVEVRANEVVLAANAIENAALLLRSDLDDGVAGRNLADHGHRLLHVECDVPTGAGYGASVTTGLSLAWADGPFRAQRAAAVLLPVNAGVELSEVVTAQLAAGVRGAPVREAARWRKEHTLVLDTLYEDLPDPRHRVELSPRRDALGLPLNRITYSWGGSDYVRAAEAQLEQDLGERLADIGGRLVHAAHTALGGHQLGTCFMGAADGVVDAQERHHRIANLWVTGGSSFPAYSAMHPALTIAALALRLGRRLGAV